MAKQDFRVLDSHRWGPRPYHTKAGQTAIKAGEMVIQDSAGDERYVVGPVNGASNTSVWVGMAVSNDTVSASTDGVVYVVDALDAEFVGKPTTPANLTAAIRNTKVTLDIASGIQTLDEDDTTNGVFLIRDFDTNRNEVYFKIDKSTHIAA